MRVTVQDILRVGLADYLETHTLPAYQQKFVWDLLRCRTEALGGHVEECPDGHTQRVWYNSCRHRSCPQCAFLQTQQWLEKKKQQLLPCDHYHVIFTLPEELRELWRWNAEAMADLLFQTVRDTLMTLLGDEAHLGARPGLLAALHTWGRTLVFHPHLHCLVTGGGLTAEGAWKPVCNGFLLPLAAVRLVYRGKFLHGLETLVRGERLKLPPDLSMSGALQLLRQASRKKWNVRIEERYEHGRGVATYLARYLRGGPIKSSRVISYDRHSVTFRYGDHR
ncbi:MAG TPA: transposase, partial [Thermoanaerobaculia bacterium]|nr:transposase [Thermoanaerobaculia bacterium]